MKVKICKLCSEPITPGDTYKGVGNRHRRCHREAVKKHRRDNPSVQAYDRERSKLPHRQAHNRANTKRWRQENPAAYKAETAVGNAVRDGKLKKKPCEMCGDVKVHAHHDDYAKPLDVRWLCALHHHRFHAEVV